jgi:hypothetical protein
VATTLDAPLDMSRPGGWSDRWNQNDVREIDERTVGTSADPVLLASNGDETGDLLEHALWNWEHDVCQLSASSLGARSRRMKPCRASQLTSLRVTPRAMAVSTVIPTS